MQYFKPHDPRQFVGDCMPFFHQGVFHLFWLLDENHHHSLGGLGAHQWAHATTTDLVHWEHHPLAIPITAEREGSICTGSVFFHEGLFRAYYATRMRDRVEHLSLAVSSDGIRFEKTEPNPFASPGEQYTGSYRDPHVFRDPATGLFHLLVTSSLREYPVHGGGGCLAQLISRDLQTWEPVEPFLIPGYPGDPECCDTFGWHGWHYLIFSNDGVARYRMARSPLGPWHRPPVDTFDGPMARVMKTAAFTGDRRLGVAFLPTLEGDRDDGGWQYGGHAIFREIIQHEDGTLGTKWPREMIPAGGEALPVRLEPLTGGVTAEGATVRLEAEEGFAAAALGETPLNARITARVSPEAGSSTVGLCLRACGAYETGYELRLSIPEGRAEIRRVPSPSFGDNAAHALSGLTGLDRPFSLDVILRGDIIDVCVDQRRCLINRLPDLKGGGLLLFAHNARVAFEELQVRPLL